MPLSHESRRHEPVDWRSEHGACDSVLLDPTTVSIGWRGDLVSKPGVQCESPPLTAANQHNSAAWPAHGLHATILVRLRKCSKRWAECRRIEARGKGGDGTRLDQGRNAAPDGTVGQVYHLVSQFGWLRGTDLSPRLGNGAVTNRP